MGGLFVPVFALGVHGVSWLGLFAVSILAGGFLFWTLGGPPVRKTVTQFLWGVAGYVFGLTGLLELELR